MKLMNGGSAGVAETDGPTLSGGLDPIDKRQAVYTITVGDFEDGQEIEFSLNDESTVYSFTLTVDETAEIDSGVVGVIGIKDVEDAGGRATALEKAISAALEDANIAAAWEVSANGNIVTITAKENEAFDGAQGNQVTIISNSLTDTTVVRTTDGADAAAAVASTGKINFGSNLLASGTQIVVSDKTFVLYDSSKGDIAPIGANDIGIDIAGFSSNEEIIDAMVAETNNVAGVTLSKTAQNEITVTADTPGASGNTIQISVSGPEGQTNAYSADFQIGANKGQSMSINILDMRSFALGISSLSGTGTTVTIDGQEYEVAWAEKGVTNGTDNVVGEAGLSVATHADAAKAVEVLDAAIGKVSAERSKLGAFQNRLEHTISNLGTSAENLQAAESRIRDLDMAEEIMAFTKNNILQQAATAMLAQANMAPQSVLQLLG
jgi:flagellin